jgi:hypothetical protein
MTVIKVINYGSIPRNYFVNASGNLEKFIENFDQESSKYVLLVLHLLLRIENE